jgi:hypothetical protein
MTTAIDSNSSPPPVSCRRECKREKRKGMQAGEGLERTATSMSHRPPRTLPSRMSCRRDAEELQLHSEALSLSSSA